MTPQKALAARIARACACMEEQMVQLNSRQADVYCSKSVAEAVVAWLKGQGWKPEVTAPGGEDGPMRKVIVKWEA